MKRLREAFSAETLLAEARRSTVTSAVIVHHMFQHGLVQPDGLIVRFGLLVVIRARANWQRRYLCENGVVNLVGTGEAELAIEDTQDVTVRQPTLLKLGDGKVRIGGPKDRFFFDVGQQFIQLLTKDSAHNVWSIARLQPLGEGVDNLGPVRIARERDEEGRFTVRANDRHRILIASVQISIAADEAAAENHTLPDFLACVPRCDMVDEVLVEHGPNSCLIVTLPLQPAMLRLCKGAAYVLLKTRTCDREQCSGSTRSLSGHASRLRA